MARPKRVSDPITLRFPIDVVERLQARADAHGETLREYLQRNLTAAVATAEQTTPPQTGRLRGSRPTRDRDYTRAKS